MPVSQSGGSVPWKGKTKEHWMELCEQAAVEQDSEKLIELINEIDRGWPRRISA
jgi:hypothetical protein